jgi:hypothetical protein
VQRSVTVRVQGGSGPAAVGVGEATVGIGVPAGTVRAGWL